MTAVQDVDPGGALKLVDESGAILLDVREDDEWGAGHAPGAVHLRLGRLDPGAFAATTPVVAVCRSGNRSGSAAKRLAAAGVTVYNMVGGMKAWRDAGLPVIRDDATAGTVL
ncbi:rhodanese-like domain-containing protein [Mycobacterium sp. MBM]|nr:rhodanese-like domain-containing protein [Mycobacterium sp. MBM]